MSGANQDADKVNTLIALTNELNGYNLEEAFRYGYQALPLARKSDSKTQAKLFIAIGRTHANSSQPDSALQYFERALAISEKNGDEAGRADALGKIRYIANYLGQYEKEFEIAYQVLRIREQLGDKTEIALANIDVGNALYYQRKYEAANEYNLKAYEQMLAVNADNADQGVATQQLADTYLMLGDYDQALEYADEALRLRVLDDNPVDIALSQNTRGNILKYLKRYDDALAAYRESFELSQEVGFATLQFTNLNNIGDVYRRVGNYREALSALQQMQQMMAAYGPGQQRINPESLFLISEAYEGLGQLDSALIYYKRYTAINDSLFTAEADSRVAELQTKYETAQKEITIYEQQEQLEKEQSMRWYAIGIAVLLLVIALLLLQGYHTIRQKNRNIETLLYEIHHRVKNNLQVLSSLLSLQSRYIEDAHALDAIREGQNRVDAMGLIHQQLYTGNTAAALNMETYLYELGETVADSFGLEQQPVELKYELSPVELDADTAIPLGLIANELLTNACKYAFPEGHSGTITLHFSTPPKGGYLLKVQDDGVGKTQTRDVKPGTSFGTRLIQLLSQKLKAEVEELDGPGYGMTVWFAIR